MEESEKLEVEKDPDLSQEIEFLREEIYRMEIAQQDQAQKIAQHLNEEEKSRWLKIAPFMMKISKKWDNRGHRVTCGIDKTVFLSYFSRLSINR